MSLHSTNMPRDTAGGIIVRNDGKIVLVNQGHNVWSFPKGGIEDGEEPLTAALREVEEETGLADLQLVSELGSYKRRRIAKSGIGEDTSRPEDTRTFFLFKTKAEEVRGDGREIVEARFVSIDEALAMLMHPKDAEFLRSVRNKIEEALQ